MQKKDLLHFLKDGCNSVWLQFHVNPIYLFSRVVFLIDCEKKETDNPTNNNAFRWYCFYNNLHLICITLHNLINGTATAPSNCAIWKEYI